MVWFPNMVSNQTHKSKVLEIARNPYDRTILGLAPAVQTKVFATRHTTFAQ